MNSGVIASRYAKALLKLVQEAGTGEKVYSQVCVLMYGMQQVRQLADALLKHPEMSLERRLGIIEAAIGEPMADEFRRFALLVHDHGRNDVFLRMLLVFADMYRDANNIKVGRLITAVPLPELKDKLQVMIGEMTGSTVLLDDREDPSVMGGFILEIDDLKLDASIRERFRRLRRELVVNESRII